MGRDSGGLRAEVTWFATVVTVENIAEGAHAGEADGAGWLAQMLLEIVGQVGREAGRFGEAGAAFARMP
jgi:hypothetical protein